MKSFGVAALGASALTYGCGAFAARLAAARHPAGIAVDFAQPLVVVTAWGPYGSHAFAPLAATVAAATALLIAGSIARRRDLRTRRALDARDAEATGAGFGDASFVALLAAIALAGCAAWPFVFSSDAYAYAAYGEMAARGIDPYRLVPPGAHGPFVDAARFQWSGRFPVCVYGPAFVAYARAIVGLARGGGVAFTLAVFRALGALAFLASIFAFASIVRALPVSRRFVALAAYGLNPVVLWSVAEGHNDALLGALALGGIAVVRAAKTQLPAFAGAAIVGLSSTLKGTGIAFAAVLGCGLAGPWRGAHARAAIAALGGSVALAAAIALPPMWPAFTALGRHGTYAPGASLQTLAGPVPIVAAALAAGAYGTYAIARGDARAFAWLGIAAWLALPNPYPWYALWLAPLAAMSGGGWAAYALWGATISSVVRYVPDAAGPAAIDGRIVAVLAALPLGLLLAAGLRRPPSRPSPSQKATPST